MRGSDRAADVGPLHEGRCLGILACAPGSVGSAIDVDVRGDEVVGAHICQGAEFEVRYEGDGAQRKWWAQLKKTGKSVADEQMISSLTMPSAYGYIAARYPSKATPQALSAASSIEEVGWYFARAGSFAYRDQSGTPSGVVGVSVRVQPKNSWPAWSAVQSTGVPAALPSASVFRLSGLGRRR